MSKIIIFILLLTPFSALADQLDDVAAICLKHRNKAFVNRMMSERPFPGGGLIPEWEQGWEHCRTIVSQWSERKRQKDLQDEETNPDLKATRDFMRSPQK